MRPKEFRACVQSSVSFFLWKRNYLKQIFPHSMSLVNLVPANTDSSATLHSYNSWFPRQITLFWQHRTMGIGTGGGEELQLQSHEDQELSTDGAGCQLIFQMRERSRHDLCVISHSMHHNMTQTLKIVLKRPMTFHRSPTRHVHLCSHNFGQQNHTATSLVRHIGTFLQ